MCHLLLDFSGHSLLIVHYGLHFLVFLKCVVIWEEKLGKHENSDNKRETTDG